MKHKISKTPRTLVGNEQAGNSALEPRYLPLGCRYHVFKYGCLGPKYEYLAFGCRDLACACRYLVSKRRVAPSRSNVLGSQVLNHVVVVSHSKVPHWRVPDPAFVNTWF